MPPPLLLAAAAVAVGLSATLPARWKVLWAALPIVAITGALAGLAPGRPDSAALQPLFGGFLGIGIFTALAWVGLDALARRLSPSRPQSPVLGSLPSACSQVRFQSNKKHIISTDDQHRQKGP
jgi:hypothetical protein